MEIKSKKRNKGLPIQGKSAKESKNTKICVSLLTEKIQTGIKLEVV